MRRDPQVRGPELRPRVPSHVLPPIGAVLLALVVLIVLYGALSATSLGRDGRVAVAEVASGVVLLALALALWHRLPRHERRLAIGVKRSLTAAIGLGLALGLCFLAWMATVIAIGLAVDPGFKRRYDSIQNDVGGGTWQLALVVVALVVLAPLAEELLFRGLVLRGLARRLGFWWAALLSALIFAAAHADSYLLWPRAVGLFGGGIGLAWLYRWRGYPASVTAHAAINVVAAISLVAT